MYEIERGVPLPPRANLAGHTKYPFGEMEIGDSFFIPIDTIDGKKPSDSVSSAAYVFGKRNNKKFTTRQVREEGTIKGYRVWRVQKT